ncbi:MAG: lipopolysaccharide biosynthesis protein RfbH [Candidatus Margulisbacteria bacterium]|nr:lipopolysaccharide biosynthesis protein RfbH [Candidatus Margulisiibacteriota bacterium]
MSKETSKDKILSEVKKYYKFAFKHDDFVPGKTRVNYGGRFFDENELLNLVDSSLEFWLTYGKYSELFEKKLAAFLGVKFALLVNSGSSANLLAFMALTSPLLKDRQVHRGDEVITIAAGFPTTVAPIIQYGAIPVFVDVDLETANINVNSLEKALSKKTKALMLAHTLGNPFNIKAVKKFCKDNNIWLIEDNCDALGSRYLAEKKWPTIQSTTHLTYQYTGTFGDIGTSSFYPPHHLTMGEGGAVYTNNTLLKKIMLSLRDWGRDCWCDSGKDDTCKKRFSQQFGSLPFGYDHKYVYSHFGYNLKATDMQAAIGCAQLDKLSIFIKRRQHNFQRLFKGLSDLQEYLLLPTATENSDPSWFGFLITITDKCKFKRNDLVKFLEDNKIQTRNLFAGNLLRHPCFDSLKKGEDYKIVTNLKNTDKIMNDSFWIGVYPGLDNSKVDYMIQKIRSFVLEKI